MARNKTKKQKRKTKQPHFYQDASRNQLEQTPERKQIALEKSTMEVKREVKPEPKTRATLFSEIQVHLLYTDLLKTGVVTALVFAVLLSIFVFMR